MRPRTSDFVLATLIVLSISIPAFFFTGYTALYWTWVRGNLDAARPYLPWARNFAMLAMVGATAALVILFSPRVFPLSAKTRLVLSLLATIAIGLYAEFRNEGKFYFKTLVHFFGPGTWVHDGSNRIIPSSGDSLYRIEYSHWNDFLIGPAIVSVLFSLVFLKIYGSFRSQGPSSLGISTAVDSTDLDSALRFARILMNVGLFWFFIQAWAEKAGYVRNHYSSDEVDLPFEFAGTMLGFWMARVLTRPFHERSEKFRSTLLIDFLSAGVIGLLYTLIIGPLTEGVARAVAHGLQSVVPASLDAHEYTPFQQHMRPVELLLLAGAMWWGLNRSFRHEQLKRLSETEAPAADSKWDALITMCQALGVLTAYLLVLVIMLSILEPEGLGSTLATAGVSTVVGTALLLLVKRLGQRGLTTIFGSDDGNSNC
jgi:hypothetical protein